MKGRRPTPTTLRVVGGNAGKRSTDTKEPEVKTVTGIAAPKHLNAYAAQLWRDVQSELARAVGMGNIDIPAFELMCASYGRYRDLIDEMLEKQADGKFKLVTTYETEGRNGFQIKTKPQYHQAVQEIANFRQFAGEFGMTPAARVRLKGVGQLDLFDDDDPIAALKNKTYGSQKVS